MERRIYDAFDQICAEDGLKRRTIAFLFEQTGGYKKAKQMPRLRLLAAAACLALFLMGGAGYFVFLTPAYAISLDVNPSIELGINRFDKVVAVDTYNEDGEMVMSGLNVFYLDYREALARILADGGMERYIAQEPIIAVTVCGSSEDKSNEMLARVTAYTSSYENIHCCSSNLKEVDEAHNAGMSFGRYKAFLELQALKPDVTAEEIENLTMREIWNQIDILSGNTGTETQQGGAQGTGCGSGHGQEMFRQHGHH